MTDPGGGISRRRFIGASVATLFAAAHLSVRPRRPGRFSLHPVQPSRVEVNDATRVTLVWSRSAGADSYDLELNGTIVEGASRGDGLALAFGDRQTGFIEGHNVWRVRARRGSSSRWSAPSTFEIVPTGVVQTRRFDREDDGPIKLTNKTLTGASLSVAPGAALGRGKGLVLTCVDPSRAQATKNHLQQPIDECWVRLAVRPRRWDHAGSRVHLARVRAHDSSVSEPLVWLAGQGLTSAAAGADVVRTPADQWTQVQLGVLSDGTVELWTFDGMHERLVGRGTNSGLAGPVKDTVALGNDLPRTSSTFEVHLDGFAVGSRRLPWANPDPPVSLVRPRRLDPSALGERFSFCFGSCNNAKRVPYANTAVGAAVRSAPDFFVHLGDYGYPDGSAYSKTPGGYLALWTDLLFEDQLAQLARKPWIYIASDHDLGGNDVDATSLAPFASKTFAGWQNNDPKADGTGRYGSVELDGGRVLLVWTEGIAFRSPVTAPDSPKKTVLGRKQKAWFLRVLATTTAKLVIVASQTSIGHVTSSDWIPYATERREVIQACHASPAKAVRFISGDYHHAAWARFGPKVAEWVAAPMAMFPEPPAAAATLTDGAATAAIGPGFIGIDQALAGESQDQFNASSSFGRVAIDGRAGAATFEVRDNAGAIRRDETGFVFQEILRYA